MKRTKILLLIGLCIVLVSCSKKPTNTVEKEPTVLEDSNEVVLNIDEGNLVKEQDVKEQEDIEKYAVDDNTTVNVSKYVQWVDPKTFDEAAFLRENTGVIAAQVDKDGNLTVVLSRKIKEDLANSLKGGLEGILDGLINNGDTPFVKKVDFKPDYKEILILVDKEGYAIWSQGSQSIEDLILIPIGAYQTYADINFGTTITIKDEITSEILSSEKYPEKLEQGLTVIEERNKKEVKTLDNLEYEKLQELKEQQYLDKQEKKQGGN